MATNKTKTTAYLSILLIVVGCVIGFGSIVTNEYLKLILVLLTLGGGIFGMMKSLSTPRAQSGETDK